jgi:hypothetical protein
MPSQSKSQQRFMGMVLALQKGELTPSDVSAKVRKVAGSIDKEDAEDFASTKHKGKPEKVKQETKVRSLIRKMVRELMDEGFAGALKKEDRKAFDKMRRKQSEVLGYTLTGTSDMKVETDDATVHEAKARNYKEEYKKFQSSDKSKKYRAELNKYNRDKGTYGNGDGKDASHKGGKIAGFEKESVNRGRAEKSRLKKEGKLTEAKDLYVVATEFGNVYSGDKGVTEKQALKMLSKIAKQSRGNVNPFMIGVKYWNKPHKFNKKKIMVQEGNIGITTKKGKSIELTHKTSGKEIVVVNNPSVLKKYKKLGYLISMPERKLTEEAKGYKQALQKFIKYGNKQIKAYFKKHYDKTHDRGQYSQIALLKPGKKYDRIVNVRADEPKKSDGGVHCFIERETGIIYKPKGWTGPSKYGRASIFKPATYKKIDPHGSWLYKIYKEGKFTEGHTISFSKDEMAKLHKDGQIEKDDHLYMFKEGKWSRSKVNEAKKETIFDVAKRVVKNHQAEPYKSRRGKVLIDAQSANLLTKVWKKINPKMKQILTKLGEDNPAQLMKTLWTVAKAG